MKRAIVLAVLVTTGLGGCGSEGSRSPIRTSSTIPASDDFTPSLKATVDSRGSSVALAAVSPVTFETTGIAGDKLRFEVQFGDGESAATAVSTHVYANAGTFTARVTVVDAAGREYVATETVTVKSLLGAWYHAGLNERAHRYEVRRINILTQQGTDVTGMYSRFGSRDKPFAGRLTADRTVRITFDNGSGQFEGIVPSSVNDADTRLLLSLREDGATEPTLPFVPVVGEPNSPPPRAVLRISGANQRHIQGQEMTFDATGSTGDGLSYGMEFGDGESSTDKLSKHAWSRAGSLVVRAVVVDRFGRIDSTTSTEGVSSLSRGSPCFSGGFWFTNPFGPTGDGKHRRLRFISHQGRRVTGEYTHPEGWASSFSGELIGDREIRIVLDDGTISFSGPISFDFLPGSFSGPPHEVAPSGWARTLVRGGSADGMTILFAYKGCS